MINDTEQELERMSFWDHLDEFRSILIRSVSTIALFTVIFFCFMEKIFDNFILAPCSSDFIIYRKLCALLNDMNIFVDSLCEPFTISLINYNLNAQFFVHMSTSLWLGLIFSFPIIIYFLWSFISPALYPEEKKGIVSAFALGNIFFYTGILVGYFLVFPITLRFFAFYKVSNLIDNNISFESYMSNFLTMIFLIGIVFELPLLCKILSAMGLIRRSFFKIYRRHAVVVLLIISAIITPSDPFSMIILFIPLWILFELSAFLVKK